MSKTSSGNRLDSNTSGGHNLEDDDSDDKDQTLTMTMTMMVGMGTNQRIESLKLRRRSDRINTILTAAARGDLKGLKDAVRVCFEFSC